MSTRAAASSATVEADPNTAPVYLLGNGRYAALLTRCGAGYSAFAGRALYRWTPDRLRQLQGFFLYLRDLDNGACWSAGYEPLVRRPSRYDVHAVDGRVVILREDDGIESRLEVCVTPADDVELRRLTVTNASTRLRRLEVTSYLELVLNDLRSDAAHPAFSKLFVQTAWSADTSALLAWRRQRTPDEAPLWVAHRLVGVAAVTTFETDRMRFLGRGRSTANPRALDANACLSGTAGNVLDPVFSMRQSMQLEPGQSATLTAVLAAAAQRDRIESLITRYDSETTVAAGFAAARVSHSSNKANAIAVWPPRAVSGSAAASWAALGLPKAWLNSVGAGPVLESDERKVLGDALIGAPLQTIEQGPDHERLQFYNGYGGFSEDGLEYVIRLTPGEDGLSYPPLPWTNVVANEQIGFIASESGGGYTWVGNSRRHRLTPWSNDPVSDPPSEVVYIRDEDAGTYWSATPAPAPGGGAYQVRHGLGYTIYQHTGHQLDHELCVFVPRHDAVKLARLSLRNTSEQTRRLSLFGYARWVLGAKAQETASSIVTRFDAATRTIYARNRQNASPAVAFAALSGGDDVYGTADRAAFLGAHGSTAAPAAVMNRSELARLFGSELDPCAALQTSLSLAPHQTASLVFLLGEAEDETAAAALVGAYSVNANVDRALVDVRTFWRELVSGVQVRTPSPVIDLMVNGWLAYQTVSCRLWGRSAFYQSGGAYGFRDQLQDTSALVYLAPELTRAQILLHAAHQFREGDVLHWWHPPDGLGIRTRFADDLLWLPYIAAFYVRATGDETVLDERARFLTARALAADEDEISVVPEESSESGTVYEHCCRAIDRSLTRGAHGLPLIGTGDWNDGMNRVGRAGRGESVWLGFFLYDILDDVIPIVDRRADHDRAARYRAYRIELQRALNDAGWDGAWYRRAYYDDGTPIGSATSDECRIDAIAQAWAVLSGAAPRDRAERALDALEQQLVDEEHGLIRLLTPPFDRTLHDPGYIKGYLPGVRENGGQYTHGALWAVRALAEAGRIDRAAQLLEMLSPVTHGRTRDEVEVYKAEPYVIAADIYGEAPHVGRAGWTWYTGSSGWMLRVALESILGFELAGGAIRLRPRVPSTWPGYSITYRVPGTQTRYEIDVRRGATASLHVELDGERVECDGETVLIPVVRDEKVHRLLVLGGD